MGWTILRSPVMQTVIGRKATQVASDMFGCKITIDKARYNFNQSFIFSGLLIEDLNKDTLLYADRIKVTINDFDLKKHIIDIRKISLREIKSHIIETDSGKFNFDFILNSFASTDTSKSTWKINCKNIQVENSYFTFQPVKGPKHDISNLGLNIRNLQYDSIKLELGLEQLQFDYNNKPMLNNLNFDFSMVENRIRISDFNLESMNSHLQMRKLDVNLPINDSLEGLWYRVDVISSQICPDDYATFIPQAAGKKGCIGFSGEITGTQEHIKGMYIRIAAGDQSEFNTHFIVENLNQKEKLEYNFQIDSLKTNRRDLLAIINSYITFDPANIPEIAGQFGNVNLSGSVTGNFHSVSANTHFKTDAGNIILKAEVNKNPNNKRLELNVNLQTAPIYLNKILQSQAFDELAVNFNTKGYISDAEGVNIDIDGSIRHIAYDQYSIDSITVVGKYEKDVFTGRVSSFDPNLRFDFEGLLNFGKNPSYNFKSYVYYANLFELGINRKDSNSNLSFNVDANFIGNSIDKSIGKIDITEIYYFKDTTYFATDSIQILSQPKGDGKEITIRSEYVNAKLDGLFDLSTLSYGISNMINTYMPSISAPSEFTDSLNNFNFTIVAEYPHPLTELFFPGFRISPGTNITGKYNSKQNFFSINLASDRVQYEKNMVNDLNIKAYTRNKLFYVNLSSKDLRYSGLTSFKNFKISSKVHTDTIDLNLNWNNWIDKNYSGNINSAITLKPSENQKSTNLKFDMYPSNIVVLDTLWSIGYGSVSMIDSSLIFNHFDINNGFSRLFVDGILSSNPKDSISINISNIDLEQISNMAKLSTKFSGVLSGTTVLKDLKGEKRINTHLAISDFGMDGQRFGTTKLDVAYDLEKKRLNVNGKLEDKPEMGTYFAGYIDPGNDYMDFDINMKQQDISLLELFLKPTFDNIKGSASGPLRLHGKLTSPKWDGMMILKDASMLFSSTMVNYSINDTILFKGNHIIFDDVELRDKDQNQAHLRGSMWHTDFITFYFNMKINSDKLLVYDTKSSDSPMYYGRAFASAVVDINGTSNDLVIDVSAQTLPFTRFFITLEGKSDVAENDFISFINPYQEKKKIHTDDEDEETEAKPEVSSIIPKAKTKIAIDLKVNPEAEVQIIFDPKIGDALKANGTAHLNMEATDETFAIYGTYLLDKGEFNFTLKDVINKKFDIQPGSYVSWSGDPIDADVNIDAVYRLKKASIMDLTLDQNDKEKKVPVNCHLKMANKMTSPTINFQVEVPSTSSEDAIEQLNSLPEEDLNKQVIYLLVLNKFAPLPGVSQQDNTQSSGGNVSANTASELLSNQLSKWLSQISTDFDLGIAYRPATDITEDEYEVALSTTLWDDRIIFNGNVGMGGGNSKSVNNTANSSQYTTDFSLEMKVNKKGNVRARAFQKVNDDLIYDAPYTQGFGIFYAEEFNDLNHLMKKLFHKEEDTKTEEIEIQGIDENSTDSIPSNQ